jgi:hypothetical protein
MSTMKMGSMLRRNAVLLLLCYCLSELLIVRKVLLMVCAWVVGLYRLASYDPHFQSSWFSNIYGRL